MKRHAHCPLLFWPQVQTATKTLEFKQSEVRKGRRHCQLVASRRRAAVMLEVESSGNRHGSLVDGSAFNSIARGLGNLERRSQRRRHVSSHFDSR